MRVLDVVDGVLLAALGRQVDVDVDRLVVPAREEVPARGIDPDLVDELVEEDDVAAALGHARRLAAACEVDELVDEHLDRLARVPEHLGERLEARDVPVVVGAEDVDEPVEAACVLAPDVGGVEREVRRLAVRADDDAILVVAVGARPGPHGAVRLVRVEQLDRLGRLGLDDALPLEGVEVDPEPLERRLDLLEHPRHRVALHLRELRDVGALVAALRRRRTAPRRLDRRAEEVHLRAGVVVVVLALDRRGPRTPGAARRRRRRRRFSPRRR